MTPEPEHPRPAAEGVSADQNLISQGWTRRFLADEARAAEAFEIFGSMGLEVRAEAPSKEDLGKNCSGCADAVCKSYRMIYTRERKTP